MDSLKIPVISILRSKTEHHCFSISAKSRTVSFSVLCLSIIVVVYILLIVDMNGIFFRHSTLDNHVTIDRPERVKLFGLDVSSTDGTEYRNKNDQEKEIADDFYVAEEKHGGGPGYPVTETDLEAELKVVKRDLSQRPVKDFDSINDFTDQPADGNWTFLYPADFASNLTMQDNVTNDVTRPYQSRDLPLRDGLSTDDAGSMYEKIIASLRKFMGIDSPKANATDVTSSYVINSTLFPVSLNHSSLVTGVPSLQITEPSTNNPNINDIVTTSGRLSPWWNITCWTSPSESEQCDDRKLIDLRNEFFDTMTLQRLDDLCRPGEWCLRDDVEFNQLASFDKLQQLCDVSTSCSDRLRVIEHRCGETNFLLDTLEVLCNGSRSANVTSSRCLTSLLKLIHVGLLDVIKMTSDENGYEFNMRKSLECACLSCENNNAGLFTGLPEWIRRVQENDGLLCQHPSTIVTCDHFESHYQQEDEAAEVMTSNRSVFDAMHTSQLTSVIILLTMMSLVGLTLVLLSFVSSFKTSRRDPLESRDTLTSRDRIEYSIISTEFDDLDDDLVDEDSSFSLPMLKGASV